MSRDSAEFALIRLLPSEGATDRSMDLLSRHEYVFDIVPVIAVPLRNRPGRLADVAGRLGREGININYMYGSSTGEGQEGLLVFCLDDIDRAARLLQDEE